MYSFAFTSYNVPLSLESNLLTFHRLGQLYFIFYCYPSRLRENKLCLLMSLALNFHLRIRTKYFCCSTKNQLQLTQH